MRHKVIVFLILLALILCGCSHQPRLRQPVENIIRIELINNSAHGNVIVCALVDNEIEPFMNDLLKLECQKRLQPIGDFSEQEIRIYYENGDIDIIGSRADGYIEQGKLHINGWYYYKEDALREIFDAYAK